MLTFDTPTPFSTVGRRNVTNVPAQGLARMNDKLFHDQARVWAERLLRETVEFSAADRVQWLFECAFARLADETELRLCLDSLSQLQKFHQSGLEKTEIWADLCHALFNLNDFIFLR